ncbi:MAG: hypothetical protein WAN59_02300 [Candidatus Baltobacteraceae bacterium]
MIARVAHYRKRPTSDKDEVGCIILSSTVFLEEAEWIEAPADFLDNCDRIAGYIQGLDRSVSRETASSVTRWSDAWNGSARQPSVSAIKLRC